MNFIKLIFTGIVIGIANVIPGVSGGTMAVVFGIYDELISVITFNVKKIISKWKFWVPLFGGMGIGIILFSKVVTFLFEHFPVQTQFFFVGIVAGSIPLLLSKTDLSFKKKAGFNWLFAILAFALMIGMVFINTESVNSAIQTELNFGLAMKLLFGGALAAFAMIIPGISGSFLLVVLGIYSTVIGAVSDFNIPILLIVGVGILAGLFGGAKGVRVLLAKVPEQTYGAIFGLVIGSIFEILPVEGTIQFFKNGAVLPLLASLGCIAAGFVIAFFGGKERKEEV